MTEGREKPIESQPSHGTEAPQAGDAKASSRRRLLRAGILAAPLLVTLHSRPVHAAVSLGSLGIEYGLYVQNQQDQWVPAVDQNGTLVPDPNGADRRPDTGDEPPPPPPP